MSKPTIRTLLDKIGSFADGSPSFVLAERVEKVLALHCEERDPIEDATFCAHYWPCAIVRALEGE